MKRSNYVAVYIILLCTVMSRCSTSEDVTSTPQVVEEVEQGVDE